MKKMLGKYSERKTDVVILISEKICFMAKKEILEVKRAIT